MLFSSLSRKHMMNHSAQWQTVNCRSVEQDRRLHRSGEKNSIEREFKLNETSRCDSQVHGYGSGSKFNSPMISRTTREGSRSDVASLKLRRESPPSPAMFLTVVFIDRKRKKFVVFSHVVFKFPLEKDRTTITIRENVRC